MSLIGTHYKFFENIYYLIHPEYVEFIYYLVFLFDIQEKINLIKKRL